MITAYTTICGVVSVTFRLVASEDIADADKPPWANCSVEQHEESGVA